MTKKKHIPQKQNPTLKKAMLAALEKTLNIVTQACKVAGIDRSTHYAWMREDPEYAKAVRDLDDMVLDFAESNSLTCFAIGITSQPLARRFQ